MNSVDTLTSCEDKNNFEQTSFRFYTYYGSCETVKIINYIQIGAATALFLLLL